jgi:PPK2 family polyphosphate:nucleotide phosphotransferase
MIRTRGFAKPFRVTDGRGFRLKDVDPADTGSIRSRRQAERWLERGVGHLTRLQEKHVMSGVNPQGCQVYSFKAPSAEELDHDFLWRTGRCLPERGRIGIFNRSYYEETLVVRVHPEFLEKQKLPASLVTKNIWTERFADIAAFERYAARNGIGICKFFLHISREEQKQRFLRRLDLDSKNWKFSSADVKEREHWDKYMHAYEQMIRHTSAPHAPWYVVPADHKWFTRLVVVTAIIEALEQMRLAFPTIDRAKRKELEIARKALESE